MKKKFNTLKELHAEKGESQLEIIVDNDVLFFYDNGNELAIQENIDAVVMIKALFPHADVNWI